MRSLPHLVRLAHRDPHVGVDVVHALDARLAGRRSAVTLPPLAFASSCASLTSAFSGQRSFGATSRTSMPTSAPPIISELPMLLARIAHERVADGGQRLVGVLLHGQHVRQDLGGVELVGRARSTRAHQPTGRASRPSVWSKPRYSMPSYSRPSTRAVSLTDSLWPICDDAGRDRSRARPGRRRRPRTSIGCVWRSSRR